MTERKIVRIEAICPQCDGHNFVRVYLDEYLLWQSGVNLQVAMPEMSLEKRELLITGMCPTCWNAAFPADDEPSIWPDEVEE